MFLMVNLEQMQKLEEVFVELQEELNLNVKNNMQRNMIQLMQIIPKI